MEDEWQQTLAEMVRRDTWEQTNAALDRELKEVKEQHTRDVEEMKSDTPSAIAELKERFSPLLCG